MSAEKYWRRTAHCHHAAMLVMGTLLASRLAAAPASAPAVDTPVQLRPLEEISATGSVDYAPSESRLQELAPEILDISITAVETKPLTGNNVPVGAVSVTANATVVGVLRSATRLKSGEQIKISYTQLPAVAGRGVPAQIPMPKERAEYIAYLIGPVAEAYAPFAGSRSFMDPAAPDQIALSLDTTVRGALLNPKLLPMPQDPGPSGVIKLSGDRLKQWAEVSQVNGQWQVLLREFKEPLPLRVSGNATPAPLAYYLKPVIAPATQPTVLVYSIGTEDTGHPALGIVNVERALIIDPKGRLLGDALWARRTDKDMLVPLPDWRWLSYRLEVADPLLRTTQYISLIAPDNNDDVKK